jgi:D-3-phosphoglycerate dehydrogenase
MATKVAILGDLFVRASVLERTVREHLAPICGKLEFVTQESDWPLTTQAHDAKLREFVGDPEEVASMTADANIIIHHLPPITRLVIERSPRLQVIGCCRTEPVNVDVEAATAAGIPVVFAPGRNAPAVAEFTVGLIIAECRDIGRGHHALAQGNWRSDLYVYDRAPRELSGQTVGLIGFGHIGQLMPALLKPFGLRVLAYDPYVAAAVFADKGAEQITDMNSLLAQSDIVSLHARVTPETTGFVGEEQFRRMKPGAYFINTARGPMVDYDALYRTLTSGHLRGAGLETFAVEPTPPDLPLLRLENVTLTPHIAGCTVESVTRAAEMVSIDIANFYAGKALVNCSNPGVLDR